ncbi:hypothetical protein PYCC9005_005276 [Savitreella phatthalungensis]
MDQKLYEKHAGFVPLLASKLVALAAIAPDHRVLDLGCGDGVLTLQIQTSLTSSTQLTEDMCAAASARGVVDVRQASLADLSQRWPDLQRRQFDVVYTNAVLHWVPGLNLIPGRLVSESDPLKGVADALKPDGVFVGEFGGFGNCSDVLPALTIAVATQLTVLNPEISLVAAVKRVGGTAWPFYFPTAQQWKHRLELTGWFDVQTVEIEHRDTQLPSKVSDWCRTFCQRWRDQLPDGPHGDAAWEAALAVLDEGIHNSSFEASSGRHHVQYKRIRFRAVRTA